MLKHNRNSFQVYSPIKATCEIKTSREQRWGLIFVKLFLIIFNNISVITNVMKTFFVKAYEELVGIVSLM